MERWQSINQIIGKCTVPPWRARERERESVCSFGRETEDVSMSGNEDTLKLLKPSVTLQILYIS